MKNLLNSLINILIAEALKKSMNNQKIFYIRYLIEKNKNLIFLEDKFILNIRSRKFQYNSAIQFLFSDVSSYMTGAKLHVDRRLTTY